MHAHGFGLLGEVVQDALTVALLEVVLPPVGVLLAVGEHGVDQSGQFVGSGRDGLGLVHLTLNVNWTQRRLRSSVQQTWRPWWGCRVSAS